MYLKRFKYVFILLKKYVIINLVIQMNKKNSPGRPKGKNKDNRLNIMIPTSIKNEFQTITKKNGSNISVKTCELIVDYINKNKECIKNENERN